jgi:hypothetical protein
MLQLCRLLALANPLALFFRAGRYIPSGPVLQCTSFALLGNEVPDKLIPPLQQVRVTKHER